MTARHPQWLTIVVAALLTLGGAAPVEAQLAEWNQAASGLWNVPTNWNPPVVPNNLLGGSYDVSIGPLPPVPFTVEIDTNIEITSLQVFATTNIQHTSGTFTVLGIAELLSGNYTLDGGTLAGGALEQLGGALLFGTSPGSTLDGIFVGGDLNLGSGEGVRVRGGASIGGNVNVVGGALTVEGPLTLDASTVNVNAGSIAVVSDTLTFGSASQVNLGDQSVIDSGGGLGTVVNRGTIAAGSGPGEDQSINPTTFENYGTVAVAGANLFLGPTNPAINRGAINISPGSALVMSADLQNIDTGVVAGSGTIDFSAIGLPFTNAGVVRPGSPLGTLTVSGSYTQTVEGTLEIEVGGLVPGMTHDVLDVTGDAILAGTLDVPLVNGFIPGSGDTITFLTTAGPVGVQGQFDAVTSPNLGTALGRAISVSYGVNSVSLTFGDVDSNNAFQSPLPVTEWSAGPNWSIAQPGSVNETLLENFIGAPQQVNVTDATGNVQVHELAIIGASPFAPMTLNVTDNATLAATTSVTITPYGNLELGDAASGVGTVAASDLTVEQEGVVRGNGTLRADVTVLPGGTISPGYSVGSVTVDGDYTQNAGAVLDIDVESDGGSGFVNDTLTITGDADLGGLLRVDATGAGLNAGDLVVIITAGSLEAGEIFDDVETIGGDGLYFKPIYVNEDPPPTSSTSSGCGVNVCLEGLLIGDMNGDQVIDQFDVPEFALALTDPLAYFAANFVFGDQSGDLDANGRLDFDDIEDFAAAVGSSTSAIFDAIVALSVPEPGSIVSLATLLATCAGLAGRGRPR